MDSFSSVKGERSRTATCKCSPPQVQSMFLSSLKGKGETEGLFMMG